MAGDQVSCARTEAGSPRCKRYESVAACSTGARHGGAAVPSQMVSGHVMATGVRNHAPIGHPHHDSDSPGSLSCVSGRASSDLTRAENIRGTQRDARRSACAGARRNHRPHCAVQINPGEVRARTRGICEPCLEASRSRRSRRVARCCTGAAIPRRAKARAHIARKSKRARGPGLRALSHS